MVQSIRVRIADHLTSVSVVATEREARSPIPPELSNVAAGVEARGDPRGRLDRPPGRGRCGRSGLRRLGEARCTVTAVAVCQCVGQRRSRSTRSTVTFANATATASTSPTIVIGWVGITIRTRRRAIGDCRRRPRVGQVDVLLHRQSNGGQRHFAITYTARTTTTSPTVAVHFTTPACHLGDRHLPHQPVRRPRSCVPTPHAGRRTARHRPGPRRRPSRGAPPRAR